jgi:hypothetical protein
MSRRRQGALFDDPLPIWRWAIQKFMGPINDWYEYTHLAAPLAAALMFCRWNVATLTTVLVGGSIGLSLAVVLQPLLAVAPRARDNTPIVYRAGHGRVL